MLNTLNINLKTDIKTDRPTTLPIKLMSQDKNNSQFILRFTNGGEPVALDDTYTVEVLTKFSKSGVSRLTSATVRQDYATWQFDTAYITQDETVYNYVYVRKSGNLIVSADANCFVFSVDLSEIDKGAGKVAETYDENYEKYLDEFKDNVDFEEIAQAEQARREAELLREESYNQKVDTAIVEADVAAKVDNKVTELAPQINNLTAQLAHIALEQSKVAIKAKKYDIGEIIYSDLYGGSRWKVEKQPKIGNYNIDFDDETQFEITLKGDTKGYAVLQLDSVSEYCRRIQTEMYSKTLTLLRRRKPVEIVAKGDSILWGQGAGIDLNGVATNFGDGSKHVQTRLAKPIPDVLQESLRNVYGVDTINVSNYGYSGDHTALSYTRHRKITGATTTVLFLGTNDMLYATRNGLNIDEIFNDNNAHSINNFIKNYRKTIIREQLRGSSIILLNSFKWSGPISTFNGHATGAAKVMKYYKNATEKLAKELNLPIIDLEDFVGGYTNGVALSGVHPTDFGAEVIGKRLVSTFIGNGLDDSNKIIGERQIVAYDFSENVIYGGATGDNIIPSSNSNSFSEHFSNPTTAYNYITSTDGVYLSFYTESENMCVMPIVQLLNSKSPRVELDFGIEQPEYKLDVGLGKTTQDLSAPAGYFQYQYVLGDLLYNYPREDKINFIRINGKGWHTVRITDQLLLHGFSFFDYEKYRLQELKKSYDGYMNTLAYTNLTLLNGIGFSGTYTPSYKMDNGKYVFRGAITNSNYNTKVKICDLDLPNTYTQTFTTPNKTKIEYNREGKCLYWVPNTESGAASSNLANLSVIEIYPAYV